MAKTKTNKLRKLTDDIIMVFVVIGCIIGGTLAVIVKVAQSLVYHIYTAIKEEFEEEAFVNANPITEETEEILNSIEDKYKKHVAELRRLLQYTENKLYYSVEKTEFPNGRIREYVNFFTYDRRTVAVENANTLVNTVLNNVLAVYKGKSQKLQNTIVLEDYACDMKDLTARISQVTGLKDVKAVVS